MKVAIIGGGSTYTPELIQGFLDRVSTFPVTQLWLMDIDPQRLAVVGNFARRMAAGVMESEALNAMGRELGIGGAAPRTPLKKALFSDRKRSPPVKVASPLPGVVQVRSGRKTA